MSAQIVSMELRQWIVDQTQAGVTGEAVLKAMITSGWDEFVARRALEETMLEHQARLRRQQGLPEPTPVPGPDLSSQATTLLAHDRDIKVLFSMRLPRVVLFEGFLSEHECDALRQAARPRLSRSETVATRADGSEVNEARTSQGMFFERQETPLCAGIEARIASLLSWPVERGEGLQVLRYQPGAEYLPHFDYFDPAHASTPAILQRGGQRVGTLVIYLNTPTRGGATTFPDARLEVAPVKGNAVFFSYDRPHPSTLTLHGGAPVIEGEKWVATKWLREGRFD